MSIWIPSVSKFKSEKAKLLRSITGGAWLAHSVEYTTPDLGVVSSNPTLGADLTKKETATALENIKE